jgi:predicted membrane-bound mannosyltransferase
MGRASDHDDSSESGGAGRGRDSGRARGFWIASALALAAALFWVATSTEVYELTSPSVLLFHVLLRKTYSIVAFAVLGFIADKALGPSARAAPRAALLLAAYSAAIEVAQFAHGTREGLSWNVVDVLCGAAGGWLGVVAGRITRLRRRA